MYPVLCWFVQIRVSSVEWAPLSSLLPDSGARIQSQTSYARTISIDWARLGLKTETKSRQRNVVF